MALTTTTLAEYKAWAGIGTTADDTRLTSIIASCTALAGRRANRLAPLYTWDTGTYTEKCDGQASAEITLTNTPITSVTSVVITDGTGATLETLASTDYKYEAATGRLSMTPTYTGRWSPDFSGTPAYRPAGFPSWGQSPAFPDQFQNVTVVYVGGYTVGSAPEDLKMALWRITDWVRNKGPAPGGGPAGSFATSDFDEFVYSVLRDYIREGNR